MNCHNVMLSSGLLKPDVGGEKGALISEDGREGSRRGIMTMIPMAAKAVRMARMVEMSDLLSPEVVPSISTMSCVATIVQ